MNDTGGNGAGGASGTRGEDAGINEELRKALHGFSNHDYRDRFWPGRRYEDQCDRIALRAFLPPRGDRLIDVGAGFGRLADEYCSYREVVLMDPSTTMNDAARDQVGEDPRFAVVNGHAAALPFPDASFDAVVCVRVIHHVSDPRPAILEFARILRPGGVLVLEYANKRNLKMIAAYLLRRELESPFAAGSTPRHDVVLFNASRSTPGADPGSNPVTDDPRSEEWHSHYSFLHAPQDIRATLRSAGFSIKATRSVSLLRLPWMTGHIPNPILVSLERAIQPGFGWLAPAPSIAVKAVRNAGANDRAPATNGVAP